MRGSPVHIPQLLTPKVLAIGKLTEMHGAELRDVWAIEDVPCWRSEGALAGNGMPCELWIGRQDFLIRKVVSRPQSGSVMEEVHQNIRINTPIADEIFDPKPAKD